MRSFERRKFETEGRDVRGEGRLGVLLLRVLFGLGDRGVRRRMQTQLKGGHKGTLRLREPGPKLGEEKW